MNRNTFLALAAFTWLAVASPARAGLIVDFTHGAPPPSSASVTPLTASTGLDFSQGRMDTTVTNFGDGVAIDVPNLFAECVQFHGLDFQGFGTGTGIRFETILGPDADGNGYGVDIVQSDSIKVKIFDEQGHMVKTLTELLIENFDLTATRGVQIDGFKSENGFTIGVVVTLFNGTSNPKKVAVSAMTDVDITQHGTRSGSHYAMKYTARFGNDPGLGVTEADLDEFHTPEPSTCTLFGIGVLALLGYGWRCRKPAGA
jgi:hypothetical protein